MVLRVGDTVRVLHNGRIGTVKQTGVSSKVQIEGARRITRLEDGNTVVLLHWKKDGGGSYADGPRQFMVVNKDMLQKR